MKIHKSHNLLTLFALVVAGCAVAPSHDEGFRLTPEHFRKTATIEDDSLEITATISTYNGFQQAENDNFLRAFIDKKTGYAIFQVYQVIKYRTGWRYYRSVNYQTQFGPKSEATTNIASDVACYSSSCKYVEHVGFEIEEALLRVVGSEYSPGAQIGWHFKFKAKSGDDYTGWILPAEVAGLLASVDDYRRTYGLFSAR